MKENPIVMVSSTVKDLPDYRLKVQDACLRADTKPQMMEHLSSSDENAINVSLKMVDESDIYIGVFAHKYGSIPPGHEISITEMEYNRAVEKKLPILIFMISDEVAVKPKDFDTGQAAEKLHALKRKLGENYVVTFFENPQHLSGKVFESLLKLKEKYQKERGEEIDKGELWAKKLHAHANIPLKPDAFIAHPYTLL
ncbi:MAG: DUF4062 domain-containing protein, partial [Bacteroidetes bacterium]|nr:DUF4062 domain-containing protein [Bacteroidota bacterium]